MAAPAEIVTGSVNDTLTLPCSYRVQGAEYTMCWGRGRCTTSGCDDRIIKTGGKKVTTRKSTRYDLLGNIRQGDVSLTITGVTKEDAGTYCCRVEVTGPFNDLKKEVELKIENGENLVTAKTSDLLPTTMDQDMFTTYNVTCIPGTRRTFFPTQDSMAKDGITYVTAGVGGALFLVALMAAIVYIRKYRRGKRKAKSSRSVINVEALAGTGNEATENIYT